MPRFLSSVLLSLVLGAALPGWSATADEREQQAIAIVKLITARLQLPAERQLAGYQQAGHSAGDRALAKILRFLYLDTFPLSSTTADQDALETERTWLQRDLTRAASAGELGAVAQHLFIDHVEANAHAVNRIARLMHPDGPPPLVPLGEENKRTLTQQLATLGRQAEESFALAVGRVKAANDDNDFFRFPEGSKEQVAALEAAIKRRLDALRPLLLAMHVLRDAAQRGQEFGIDPTPVRAQLTRLFTSPRSEWGGKTWADVLSTWEFEWGEFNPYITAACCVLLGDALVAGATGVSKQDVIGILQKLADFHTHNYNDPTIRNAAYRLKLQAWADLLRFHLIVGDGEALDRGWAAWQEFLTRAQSDVHLRLDGNVIHANELGQLHLMAARIAEARKDVVAARVILNSLLNARPINPLARFAKGWLDRWSTFSPATDR